ncbi:MAG: hypothetical protein ACYDCL_10945 [Myxococcales bacterium]
MRRFLTAACFALAACSSPPSRPPTGGGSGGGALVCPDGTGCSTGIPAGGTGLCCGGACVGIAADAQNCGGCGYVCPSGSTCQQGACVTPSCSGASQALYCLESDGQTIGQCCNGACVDPSQFGSDPANCGGCGLGCAASATCQNGSCAPASAGGAAYCAGDSDCAAGESCSLYASCAAASCAGASPGASCTLPLTAPDGTGICCPGGCDDPLWDDANCGGCGFACPSGEPCLNGICTPPVTCGAGNTGHLCLIASGQPGACCGDACTDVLGDPQNCGACGAACPVGASCVAGTCFFPDGGPAACTAPAVGCPGGTLCGDGVCQPSSCDGDGGFCFRGVASGPGVCCGGACVDLSSDPKHCGACGEACSGTACVPPGYSNAPSLGLCLPPAAGGDCSGAGGCPQGETCVNDVCLETDCTTLASWLCATPGGVAGACCPSSPFGALCTDLSGDPANCGSCGNACDGGTCAAGICQ